MLNLGILVSGRGSNMMSILDSIESGKLNAKVAVVISNRANALTLKEHRSVESGRCLWIPRNLFQSASMSRK